jgi:putative ABC transport system permease protein
MLIDMAFKNLFRNLRRTTLAQISIIFGVFIIVLLGNFIEGMQQAWAQFEIEANHGSFQIEHADYRRLRKSAPLKVTLDQADALLDKVRHIEGVQAAYGKLEFSGMISNGLKTTFFDGVAVDPQQQAQTLTRQEDLVVDGKPLDATPGGVVLGADLAKMLDLKIGDPVSIVVRTFYGSLNLTQARLVGLKNGRHFPSATYVEMPLADSQRLLRVNNRVSQIVVRTSGLADVPSAMASAQSALQTGTRPISTFGYWDLIPIYAQAIALFKLITYVVGIVLFVLVGGGIANVMAMAVMERRREIGTLLAIGMAQRDIRRLFMTEGAIAGAIGAAIGVLIVSLLTWYVATQGGLVLPGSSARSAGLAIIPRFSGDIGLFGAVMPVLVAVVAAWLPASKAARLSPVQALTEV